MVNIFLAQTKTKYNIRNFIIFEPFMLLTTNLDTSYNLLKWLFSQSFVAMETKLP